MTLPPRASIGILAGGRSARMGFDKALIRLDSLGPCLLERTILHVGSLADDVFVVASNRPEYEQFGVTVQADLYPDAGALGGIGTAIRQAKHDRCLVVSCDHPFLNSLLLRAMVEHQGEWDALIPVLPGESRQGGMTIRQTLHAVYTKRCLPAIETAIRKGWLQTVGFLSAVKVKEIGLDEILALDPDLRSFLSVNTPEDLERCRRWIAASRPELR